MADINSEDREVDIRIDEVEMGNVTSADGERAQEKQKFEYIHGHVEHQELHVPSLDELCKGMLDRAYLFKIFKTDNKSTYRQIYAVSSWVNAACKSAINDVVYV